MNHTSITSKQYDGTPAYNFLAYYIPVLRVEYQEESRAGETFPRIIALTRQQLYAKFQTKFARALTAGPVATAA